MKEKKEENETIRYDVDKVKKQLYEITYIEYVQEGNSWVSIVCKYADFGMIFDILAKLQSRIDQFLITDIKIMQNETKEAKQCD